MQAVIRRYALGGRPALCVVCELGYEEYWLWRAGSRLTLEDLDLHDGIERRLRGLPAPSSPSDALTIHIGRAEEMPPGAGPLVLCQMSGFTPDEMHRRDIQLGRPINMAIRALRGASRLHPMTRVSYRWPKGVAPISSLAIGIGARLQPRGLFLLQSYYYGVDVR